ALVARLQPRHALPARFIDGAQCVVPVNFAYRFLAPALRQSTGERGQAVWLHSQQARGFGPAPLFGLGVLLDISARRGGERVVAAMDTFGTLPVLARLVVGDRVAPQFTLALHLRGELAGSSQRQGLPDLRVVLQLTS